MAIGSSDSNNNYIVHISKTFQRVLFSTALRRLSVVAALPKGRRAAPAATASSAQAAAAMGQAQSSGHTHTGSDLKPSGPSEVSLASSEGHIRHRSFHEGLVRERDKKHKFDTIYEVLEDIGHGGLCQIYKIQKREDMVGGSSRPELVRRNGSSFLFLPGLLSSVVLHASSSKQSLRRMNSSSASLHSNATASSQHSNNNNNNNNRTSPPNTPTRGGERIRRESPLFFALKVINLKLVSGGPEKIDQLKNEVEILKTLDHRSIIKAYETFQRKDTKQLVIVMELCTGGDLYARMPYTEPQVACVVRQILSAVSYMHDRNVIHRDIKMENIMFESQHPDAAVKLIDFGLSAEYSKSESVLKERVGTLYSMSPETMQGNYTAQADLWSIGVCTYIMLSGGDKPFEGKTPKQVVAKVLLGQYDFDQPAWQNISDKAKDFIRQLLVVEPEKRLTASQAIRHPFITEACCDSSAMGLYVVDEELKQRVREGIIRYSASTEFRKLALNVIAKKSSAQEIFELRKVFDEFDTQNSGTITLEEFKDALAQFDYSEEDLFEIFRKVDVNRTNVINYTEFLAAALETHGTIEEYRLAEAFDQLDSDDSGYISREDLRKLLGEHTDDAYISQLISEADFKKDGRISYEEFLQVFAEKKHDHIKNIYEESEHFDDATEPEEADKVLNYFGLLP